MMACTPVVTTPIGAEGLDLVQGEHALIGADAADLAAGITRMLTDDPLWERLARQGAEYVDAPPPRRAGPRFLEIVDAVMAGSARGGGGSNGRHGDTRAGAGRTDPHDRHAGRRRAGAGERRRAVPDLTPQRAWPFPRRDGSPGGDPADGAAAVTHLEAQRQRGARWFAPRARRRAGATATRSCWTTSETRHRRLHHDEHLALYELDGRAPARAPPCRAACTCWAPTRRSGPAPRPRCWRGWRAPGPLRHPVVAVERRAGLVDPRRRPDADYVVLVDDRAVLPGGSWPT